MKRGNLYAEQDQIGPEPSFDKLRMILSKAAKAAAPKDQKLLASIRTHRMSGRVRSLEGAEQSALQIDDRLKQNSAYGSCC